MKSKADRLNWKLLIAPVTTLVTFFVASTIILFVIKDDELSTIVLLAGIAISILTLYILVKRVELSDE